MTTLRRRYRFTVTPEALVYDRRVSETAFRLWCVLDRIAGDAEVTMPTREELGQRMEKSVDTIDRATAQLVAAGWLEKESNPGRENAYTLVDEPGAAATVRPGSRIPAAPPAATVRPPASPVRDPRDSPPPPARPGGASGSTDDAAVAAFDRAWSGYPKKVERKAALKAWLATVRREGAAVVAQLETATRNYARACADKEARYVKHGATFYGPNEPWRDYLGAPPPSMPAYLAADARRPHVPDYLR